MPAATVEDQLGDAFIDCLFGKRGEFLVRSLFLLQILLKEPRAFRPTKPLRPGD
jgi:hypothetical protein